MPIDAPAHLILDCAVRQRAQDDPMLRLAIQLRELPSRLMKRSHRPPLDLDDFTFLGRDGDSEVAFGLIGAFWQPDYGLIEVPSPQAFLATERTDVCRLVMSFAVETSLAGKSILRTETRVYCPTPAVRRKFSLYWYVIRPVSGLMRRRMLARIRRQAEELAQAQ